MDVPATQVGNLAGFAQGLVGPGLIGAKRAAALEDKNDLFLGTCHAVPLQAD
jgi:hypothetical protein